MGCQLSKATSDADGSDGWWRDGNSDDGTWPDESDDATSACGAASSDERFCAARTAGDSISAGSSRCWLSRPTAEPS